MKERVIKVFVDGSCHTQQKVGGWTAIVCHDNEKVALKGITLNTTHNAMEITAAVKGVEYVIRRSLAFDSLEIYSDSQYVVHIPNRKEKLKANRFMTKTGGPVKNSKLVRRLIAYVDALPLRFIKVAAHKKGSEGLNREADLLVRKMVREYVNSRLI